MKKVLSKLITSVICIGVIAWLVMGSVQASFSDMATTQTSSFTAGTLDLQTNNANGVTQTLSFIGFIPGESSTTKTITLKNAGNINGSSLNIAVSYLQDDGTKPPGGSGTKTPDEVADEIILTNLTYGGTDLLLSITDVDADGKDLKEAAATNFGTLSGLTAGGTPTKDFTIAIQLKAGLGTAFEAEGLNLTVSFTLNQ